MMKVIFQGYFSFTGYNGTRSRCRLRVFDQPDRPTVAIATELATNPGTSIVHACESLAMEVCRRFGIEPDTLVWIEPLPARPSAGLGEWFSRVSFVRNGRQRPGSLGQPRWRPVSREFVERLLGRELERPRPTR